MTDPLDNLDDSVDTVRWSEALEEGIPEATLRRAMEHCPMRRDDCDEFYFLRSELAQALGRIEWEDSNK
jgi:hypothetical protein